MVSESALLAALLYDRNAWLAVMEHLEPDSMSAHGAAVLDAVTDYYQRDAAAVRCDKDMILSRLQRKLPKHAVTFATLLREMTPDLGATNVVHEVLELKRRKCGEELILAMNGQASAAELAPVLAEYQYLTDATSLYDTDGGISLLETGFGDLVRESKDETNLIKVRPKRVNDAIRGGLLPGHTFVIIGRVNVGKSALAIDNLAGFLRQGKRVLLIENEDLADDVKRRIGLRLCGCSMDWAEAHPEQFDERCRQRGGDLLLLPDPVPSNVQSITRAIEVLKPDVCVVNQLRHLAGGKAAVSDGVGAVDRVAQGLRALGKQRRVLMVLIGAAKEGETDPKTGMAREKAIIEKSDSYGSRTGVPGVADLMIGIGDNTTLKDRNMVALHVCKNKRGGAEPVLYQRVNLENCVFEDA